MNLGWEPRDDKQTMYFVFAIKTKHMSVSCGNGKITRKEMSKLFSCGYDRYDMVKCHRNVNFEEIDTECSTGKNDGLYCEEYLRSILNKNNLMKVIRKESSHSVDICRFIKHQWCNRKFKEIILQKDILLQGQRFLRYMYNT